MDRYELPDPKLCAYDHGLGTLSINDEVRAYLASVVGEITFPVRSPHPWFVVVWPDGMKEPAFEDYGPSWWTVRELDAGYLEHHDQGARKERGGWFGRIVTYTPGESRRFEFAWFPADEAALKWIELGLTDDDF